MLYCKSLRVSSAAKASLGVGSIVNLQSNDASKLWNLPQYLHMLWSGPFQVHCKLECRSMWSAEWKIVFPGVVKSSTWCGQPFKVSSWWCVLVSCLTVDTQASLGTDLQKHVGVQRHCAACHGSRP